MPPRAGPLLRFNPVQKHRAPGTQHGAEPEHRQAGMGRQVVDFPPSARFAEKELRDFISPTQ